MERCQRISKNIEEAQRISKNLKLSQTISRNRKQTETKTAENPKESLRIHSGGITLPAHTWK